MYICIIYVYTVLPSHYLQIIAPVLIKVSVLTRLGQWSMAAVQFSQQISALYSPRHIHVTLGQVEGIIFFHKIYQFKKQPNFLFIILHYGCKNENVEYNLLMVWCHLLDFERLIFPFCQFVAQLPSSPVKARHWPTDTFWTRLWYLGRRNCNFHFHSFNFCQSSQLPFTE